MKVQEFLQNASKDKVVMLVYINIAVFCLVRIMDFFSMMGIGTYQWLLGFLALPSADFFYTMCNRPWSVGTYMFTHYDFIHIIFNMIALFWFGKLMSSLVGKHLIVPTYLVGGGAGAIAFFFAPAALVPAYSSMIGASASVMAIMLCVATLHPNVRVNLAFIGEVKLCWVAAAYLLIDILSIPGFSNVGGHVAHLGGALAGFILAKVWEAKGIPPEKRPNSNSHLKAVRGGLADADPDRAWNRERNAKMTEIDRILDKIKTSGYNSLTDEERQTLINESGK
ncbi:MAG: rhomboid family intramembrane serine protease [Bacteroidales bacterium]|nr:rhomboid family intramembrane serine protease [Bacteroidales bacterium]